MRDVRTQPSGRADTSSSEPTRRRRRFPWWGAVPIAAPWAWFAVRDTNGAADLIAMALPAVGVASLLAALVFLGFRRLVLGTTAASLALVCLVATVGPRLPQRTGPPAHPIEIVSDNVFRAGEKPWLTAKAMIAQDADVMVSLEMGRSFWESFGRHADAYPYAVDDGEQGIRSRWPTERLPTPDGLPEGRVTRAALDADGLRVIVYAVHLFNPLHETTFSAQAAMVERLIASVETETDPAIVVGDLNMPDRSAGYRKIDSAMRDAMRTGWWAGNTYQQGLWRVLMLRIDHLFVPTAWCATDAFTFAVPGSDHRGIGATVGPCAS
jgi:endonuclease/exonuclease/phosphatase (EEP) superfamily protein YafD